MSIWKRVRIGIPQECRCIWYDIVWYNIYDNEITRYDIYHTWYMMWCIWYTICYATPWLTHRILTTPHPTQPHTTQHHTHHTTPHSIPWCIIFVVMQNRKTKYTTFCQSKATPLLQLGYGCVITTQPLCGNYLFNPGTILILFSSYSFSQKLSVKRSKTVIGYSIYVLLK